MSNPLTWTMGSSGTTVPLGNLCTTVLLGYTPTMRNGVSLVGKRRGRLRKIVLLGSTAKMK